MGKLLRNKLYIALYFVVSTLILEAVSFHVLNLGFMPQYLWMDLTVIVAIALFFMIIPNYIAQYVCNTIVLLVQTIFIYVNYSLNLIYGDLFSIDMIKYLKEANRAITSSFVYISIIFQLAATFACLAIIGFIILKYCRKHNFKVKSHFQAAAVALLVACELFSIGLYGGLRSSMVSAADITDDNYVASDAFIIQTGLLKRPHYSKFGTYGYFANLLVNTSKRTDEKIKKATKQYFKSGETYNATNSDVFGVDSGNNVIVIMMESLEWFPIGDGNYDKDVTNLSNELTPNLYSLIYGESGENDDSIIATNFFAKSKTNISEGFGIMGNYPIGYSLSSIAGKKYNSSTNAFGYTMPSVLKQLGYTTTYVHSNIISFYERDKTHKNLGFDYVVGKDGVTKDGEAIYTGENLLWNHWDAEGDFAENAIDYIIPTNYAEKPFYTFYLNVSSHGSYEYSTTEEDCLKYMYYVMYGEDDCILQNGRYILDPAKTKEELTYTTWYQNVLDNYYSTDRALCDELVFYECGVIGLDDAVGVIVNKLKEYEIFDKTTMLLYSDHLAYYNHLAHRYKGFATDDFSSIELNTIPMILSSPGVKNYNQTAENKHNVESRFCSAYDIIPTLLDLLGVEFNKNLYIGQSLFSKKDYIYTINGTPKEMILYYSNTSGIFAKEMYTYDLVHYTFTDESLSLEEKLQMINIFNIKATELLKKINYILILNTYQIFNELD